MEVSSSPSPSSSQSQPRDSEMEAIDRMPISGDETAAAGGGGWDWGDLLDFTVDGDLSINWNEPLVQIQAQPNPPPLPPPPETAATEIGAEAAEAAKVRKRDPRMTCSNFLAGLIPCACPEVDQRLMELEEEEAGHDKKRLKTRRSGGGGGGARSAAGAAKCQVPSCGVDIKELKGYHRRHRVCLRCANAASVVIAGEDKRYCQQCGKFHVVPDFDEGKRSCRRKLERHNNRRRRKPVESKGAAGKESPGDIESEDASGDVEAGKDSSQTDSQMAQKETCVESGERVSPVHTAPDVNSDGVASLLDSGETQMDGGKYNTKHGVSVSYSNKSAYSSLCPTGRISFKLYDWNPAEFPRRLRHQIFQWLANMPIELEGYIRPGCIILTVFIAMPRFMWIKLSEDPISYVHNFVVAPGGMLSGRGNILVYLNNMVFHVRKGGSSVIKANVGERAPRLHYVHPLCFEAGKPMEFVACGSNLLQPKLRFLVSFSGKYLAHNCCPASSHLPTERNCDGNFNHQLYQIRVPHTETNHFGPVFIEVENEAGLSNFIPVLIGDKETCSEIKVIQQRLDGSLVSDMPGFSSSGSPPNSCEASSLKQIAFSEVIVDIAWLLKNPESETFQQVLTTYQVQRLECLLNFLIAVESTTILEKILRNLKTSIDRIKSKHASNSVGDADLRLLQKYMDYAHQRRWHKLQTTVPSRNLLPNEVLVSEICSQNEAYSVVSFPLQDTEIMVDCKSEDLEGSVNDRRSETIQILCKERVSKANDNEKWPSEASCHAQSTEVFRTRYGPVSRFRPSLCFIAVAAVCLGVCSVIFHPHKVSEIAISIRRCLLNQV